MAKRKRFVQIRKNSGKHTKAEKIFESSYEAASNTPYDDVFRTLMTKGGRLRIPFINEMFHLAEPFPPDTVIENVVNEYFIEKGTGKQKEVITDTVLHIEGRTFHIECQSTEDGSILVRIFEYDVNIGIRESRYKNYHLDIDLPVSGVLYLRSTSGTPDYMTVSLNTQGGSVDYIVNVMRLSDYDLKDLFEKNLLFLLPFYIFNLESKFKDYENGSMEARNSVLESMTSLLDQMNRLLKDAAITVIDYMLLTDLLRKVTRHLTAKYGTVRKELGTIMGGKVLEFKGESIYNEGRAEGMAKGMAEGRAEGMAEGRAEGMAEERAKANKEKEENVRTMIHDGLEDSRIELYSGVTLKRIREIRQEEEKEAGR